MQSTNGNTGDAPHARRPYQRAHASIAASLRAGISRQGAQLVVSDIARDLRISPTPVREALARLVGEGLVEDRRGQGYYVPQLAAQDIVELYILITALTHIAIFTQPKSRRGGMERVSDAELPPVVDPPRWNLSELLARIAAQSGNALLAAEVARLSFRASVIWRVEDCLFPELRERQAELEQLFSGNHYQRLAREIGSIARLQQRRAMHVAAHLSGAKI